MIIGPFDTSKKVLIVAEIGNNHEGDFTLARRMITLAAQAGADAVKFQTIVPERLVSSANTARLRKLQSFQLSQHQFRELAAHCKEEGVLFLSTPFDLESARFLNSLQPAFKIASGDNTFYPLIDAIAQFGKPLIISTGLCDLTQIQEIENRISAIWQTLGISPGLALLHCVSSYPTPMEQANLGAIQRLKSTFPRAEIGYSDHTLGIEAATSAVAAGARIIEKHFTLDKQHSEFRDHQLAADPDEMHRLVESVRQISAMLGQGEKIAQPCERDMQTEVRRSIAAATDLPAGTRLTVEHLIWVRPGTGLPPGNEDQLLGRKTRRPLSQGELIALSDLE
ncbi:MAG: N-acetylneuraminate synthase family protein [Chromatiaceae bacterium]|nr:N-acetylneuraminate synthase family protein [Chromatiaceae bacterium]